MLIDSLADEMAEQCDRDLSFLGLLQIALENRGLVLVTAQGIETQSAETERLSPQGESPVAEGDAPKGAS
jgi:hypothetical protein